MYPASNIIQVAIEIDGMLEPRTSVTEGVGFNDERTLSCERQTSISTPFVSSRRLTRQVSSMDATAKWVRHYRSPFETWVYAEPHVRCRNDQAVQEAGTAKPAPGQLNVVGLICLMNTRLRESGAWLRRPHSFD
jgi:hypothetical protein